MLESTNYQQSKVSSDEAINNLVQATTAHSLKPEFKSDEALSSLNFTSKAMLFGASTRDLEKLWYALSSESKR